MNFFEGRTLIVGNILVLLSFLAAGIVVAPLSTAAGEVAVKVNGETVGKMELEKQIEQQFQTVKARKREQLEKNPELEKKLRANVKEGVIDQTVEQLILQTSAEEQDVEVPESEVDQRLDQVARRYPDKESFEQALKNAGISEDELRKNLKSEIRIQKFIDQNTESSEISDEEIQEYYEQNRQQFGDLSLEDVKTQIVDTLKQQRRNRQMQKLTQELRKESNVEVNF